MIPPPVRVAGALVGRQNIRTINTGAVIAVERSSVAGVQDPRRGRTADASTRSCATVVLAGAFASCLLSAAYAAVAAPATRIVRAARTTAAERHVGARELRLSGPPAPHFRHQSCPASSGAPHFAQPAVGCSAGSDAGV